jgi:hypothetical protein
MSSRDRGEPHVASPLPGGAGSVSGAFSLTGFGGLGDLAPNDFFETFVDLDTSVLGSFVGTIVFNGASHNWFQSDLALAPVSITLSGRVVADAPPPSDVPEPASGALMSLGAGALWWMRRRRAAAKDS